MSIFSSAVPRMFGRFKRSRSKSEDSSSSAVNEGDVTPYASEEDLINISSELHENNDGADDVDINHKKRKMLVEQFLQEMSPFLQFRRSECLKREFYCSVEDELTSCNNNSTPNMYSKNETIKSEFNNAGMHCSDKDQLQDTLNSN